MCNPNGGYVLHCKVKEGDAYEVPFFGFEDLGEVLAEIEAQASIQPWARGNVNEYESFGIVGIGDNQGEFCVAIL